MFQSCEIFLQDQNKSNLYCFAVSFDLKQYCASLDDFEKLSSLKSFSVILLKQLVFYNIDETRSLSLNAPLLCES